MPQAAPPQKFIRPRLGARARAGDAFIANVAAAVAQIQANRSSAASSRDPEYLHQLRVGIRRLRSTLIACRALLRRKEARRLDRRLQAALRALGRARDWDVFESVAGRLALRRFVREHAEAARLEARAAARSASMRYLPGEALAWARGRPWRQSARPGEPMQSFAGRAIERAYARLLDAADGIDWKDAQRRHRVRIRLKRLRYGCDCFAAAWPEDSIRAFEHRLRRLQSILGDLNDIDVQRVLLARIVEDGAPERAARSAAQALARRERSLLASLRSSWRHFAAVSPYWRAPEAAPAAG